MKVAGNTPVEEEEQYVEDDDVMDQQNQEQPPGLPYAQITNVNNNINFYGTVVNHVYSPAQSSRDM